VMMVRMTGDDDIVSRGHTAAGPLMMMLDLLLLKLIDPAVDLIAVLWLLAYLLLLAAKS